MAAFAFSPLAADSGGASVTGAGGASVTGAGGASVRAGDGSGVAVADADDIGSWTGAGAGTISIGITTDFCSNAVP